MLNAGLEFVKASKVTKKLFGGGILPKIKIYSPKTVLESQESELKRALDLKDVRNETDDQRAEFQWACFVMISPLIF